MHTCERSLVEQYQGRPFAILGVNGDQDRERLHLAEVKEKLNWESVWDGPNGPTAKHWDIEGTPTVFLLDQRGVIRFKSFGAPSQQELQRRINLLLQEPS
jgi:hypothetical protein